MGAWALERGPLLRSDNSTMMATTYCIVVDDSNGAPLNIAAILSDAETTVSAILEHVASVQQGRKFVEAPGQEREYIYSHLLFFQLNPSID